MLLSTPLKELHPSGTFNSIPLPPDMVDPLQPFTKKPRLEESSPNLHDNFPIPSFLSSTTTSTTSYLDHLHRQETLDVDRLISHHLEKMMMEVEERYRRFLLRAAAAFAGEVSRKLKAKEEEVEEARRVHVALEERVRTLLVEAQVWRALAENHEAAAHTLRLDLENALNSRREVPATNADEESCCDNGDDEEVEELHVKRSGMGRCKGCGEKEPCVLVLPCRHLCLCSSCASKAEVCLVCGCPKQCTVHVHLC